jgi:uncharacterized protein (TIGR03435 family)
MMRLIILVLFTSTAIAQSDSVAPNQQHPAKMTFHAASVRQVKIEPGVSYCGVFFRPFDSSHLSGNSDVRGLLQAAFSIEYYQIVGFDQLSPDVRQDLYTIEAHSDEDSDRRLAKLPNIQRRAEQQHMYQPLLIDRFRLKFHWDDRLVPGYRLGVTKRGSKLLPSGSLPRDPSLANMRVGPDMVPATIYQHHDDLGGTVYTGRGASLADIANVVAFCVRAPVQDATGLDAKYDFDLRLPARTFVGIPQENQVSIIEAVQDQLGLSPNGEDHSEGFGYRSR